MKMGNCQHLFNRFLDIAVWVLGGLAIIAVSWGCSQDKKPIKVGLATTLTGRAAAFGGDARNAAILATEEANAAGGINGRPIELIIKDDQQNPKEAVRVDRELIDQGVVAILGHYLSTTSMAVLPVVNKTDILLLGPGISHMLTGLDDNCIRINTPVDKRAIAFAGYAFKDAGLRKIAIVYDLSNPSYTVSWFQCFKREFETQGGVISGDIPFDPRKNPVMPAIVQKVIDSGAGGVFLVSNGINSALLCQHLRMKDNEIKILSSSWGTAGPSFIRHGGKSIEGVVTITQFDESSTIPAFVNFKKRYEERFQKRISLAAQLGYESAIVLFQALAKTSSSRKLKEIILSQKTFRGLTGDIVFDKYGDTRRVLNLMQVKGDKLKLIRKVHRTQTRGLGVE